MREYLIVPVRSDIPHENIFIMNFTSCNRLVLEKQHLLNNRYHRLRMDEIKVPPTTLRGPSTRTTSTPTSTTPSRAPTKYTGRGTYRDRMDSSSTSSTPSWTNLYPPSTLHHTGKRFLTEIYQMCSHEDPISSRSLRTLWRDWRRSGGTTRSTPGWPPSLKGLWQ